MATCVTLLLLFLVCLCTSLNLLPHHHLSENPPASHQGFLDRIFGMKKYSLYGHN